MGWQPCRGVARAFVGVAPVGPSHPTHRSRSCPLTTAGSARMRCRHCDNEWELEGWEYCPHCRRNYGGARYPATQTDVELRDIDALILRIRDAFDPIRLGGGQTIHQAHLKGCYNEERVWIAARAKDPETHRWDVPDRKLETGGSTLSFFDPEGWRFYIPAFMCWSLRNWRTSDSLTTDQVIWSLALSEEPWAKRYELLDRPQSEAVYDFLEFFDRYSGESDVADAIRSYWYQFRRS